MGGDIYRFRSINDNNLNALLDDELYVSVPTTFNDPFDSCFAYDINEITNLFKTKPNQLKKLFAYSYYQKHKIKLGESEINAGIELIKDSDYSLRLFIKEQCEDALMKLRQEYFVGCFSKNVDNTTLWAHYADNGKGFAIQYDNEELVKLTNAYFKKKHYSRKTFGVYSVFYNNNLIMNNELMMDILESFSELAYLMLEDHRVTRFRYELTEQNINEIFLHKSSNWSYEEEARIILPNTNLNNKHDSIGKIRPKAVYLGANIGQHIKYLITKMCEEKNIAVYQMEIDYSSGNRKLSYHSV